MTAWTDLDPLAVTVGALSVLLVALIAAVILQSRRVTRLQNRLAQSRRLLEERAQQLERASRVTKVERRSSDELTGIANHRTFQEHLELQWRRTARSRLPLTVLMIDVDGMETYNEVRGPDAGDECLRQVAAALMRELQRPGDMVARFGGDEFSVLLAETDAAGSVAVAERLRRAVKDLGITIGAGAEHGVVTVSIGVATTVPSPQERSRSLIAAADRALTIAKQRGGDTIES